VKIRDKYQVEITTRYAAVENLWYRRYTYEAWKNVKEVTKPQLQKIYVTMKRSNTAIVW